MNFLWYLDIAETSFAVEQGDPDAVAPPTIGVAAPARFSAGPIEFEPDQNISVMGLVEKIQLAFDIAYTDGVAPRQYNIVARVRPISSGLGPLAAGASGEQAVAALAARELAIEYNIYNEDNQQFRIQFRSGNHGSGGGIASMRTMLGGPPVAQITVENNPDIGAMITPYCEMAATITDRPPTPPNVSFIPYVGVNNQLMIWFGSGAGQSKERPIMLRENDISFIIDEYFSQHKINITEEEFVDSAAITTLKLQYRNDDPVRKYELFRVQYKPTSYQNFVGFNLTDDPIEAQLGPDKFSTAVGYVDSIVPNQTYWYCARSIDIHNNISNPTTIFEVEMVDNRGQMFLKTKIFNFEPKKYTYTKTGRRFLAVVPRLSQTDFDPAVSSPGTIGINQAPDSNILGDAETRGVSSVWGRKFKIRVTSKKTGRKIDLNVRFKNEGVIIP